MLIQRCDGRDDPRSCPMRALPVLLLYSVFYEFFVLLFYRILTFYCILIFCCSATSPPPRNSFYLVGVIVLIFSFLSMSLCRHRTDAPETGGRAFLITYLSVALSHVSLSLSLDTTARGRHLSRPPPSSFHIESFDFS